MHQAPAIFRHVTEALPDGLWLLDADGRTVFANPQMASLLGRDPAHPERLVGEMVDHLVAASTAERFHEHLAALAAAGAEQPIVENLPRVLYLLDGTSVPVRLSQAPARRDDGELIGWLYRFTRADAHDLAHVLKQRELELADVQEIARLGSWEVTLPERQATWSAQVARILGIPEGGQGPSLELLLEAIHPDDRELVRSSAAQAVAGAGDAGWVARVLRPDGEIRWIRSLAVVERGPDGAPARLTGTLQDISEVTQADEQARHATRRLRLLQHTASIANNATSLREALRIASLSLPQHAPGWATVGFLIVEDDALVVAEEYGSGVRPDLTLAAEARRTGQLALGLPEGNDQTHSLVALPISCDHEVVAVVELLTDEVPPDGHSHELLAQVSAQLGVVASRDRAASALARARDEAMEASRLKSEFLATMSHEIRTPMNGVIGLGELLLRTDLDDHQRRLATALQSAGQTLLAIINDILDLSKIESGKLELETADFDVRKVFEATAALLAEPAREKGLELVVACRPSVPQLLRGDATRLGQVLANLGSNAVKFTRSGEVAIIGEVVESGGTGGDDVVLRVQVSDTGVGIAPDAVDQLFEAFTQADLSTTREHGGTGLGLTISRQLVEALGGRIEVDSAVGRGSTFTFTARFAAATTPTLPRRPGDRVISGRRVLVVDDSATARELLVEQLRSWSLHPTEAASIEEALAELRAAVRGQTPFDMALVDDQMPGADGAVLARVLTVDPALAGVAVLLLATDPEAGARAADGVAGVLTKPLRIGELHAALVQVSEESPPAVERRRAPAPDDPHPLAGRRILVVEDNPVNQLVATGLLESFGATVEVAVDGVEAVERLDGDHGYAAVLMDCRMPRMDGFDATREIRRRETLIRRVPVIAMTASALEGERERCLAAGMDDFLTKPVDAAALQRVLLRWTGPQPPQAPSAPESTDPAPEPESAWSEEAVLDPERVRILGELRKDGVSFFTRTAASFTARIHGQVAAIRDAVAAGDPIRIFTSSHLVKGSALNLGANRVAAVAARIEARADTGRADGYDALLTELDAEVTDAVIALQEAIS